MKVGKRFRGTPLWNDIVHHNSRESGLTHTQEVRFIYANKYYTAIFHRFYNKREGISYDLDIRHDSTKRYSTVFAKAMLDQTQWLSTFKLNVEAWAREAYK